MRLLRHTEVVMEEFVCWRVVLLHLVHKIRKLGGHITRLDLLPGKPHSIEIYAVRRIARAGAPSLPTILMGRQISW